MGVDGASGLPYRTDSEVKAWMTRDPIPRYKRWLLAKGLATEQELAGIETDAQAAVDESVRFAREGGDPDPAAGVLNTHAEGPVLASQFYNRKGTATT